MGGGEGGGGGVGETEREASPVDTRWSYNNPKIKRDKKKKRQTKKQQQQQKTLLVGCLTSRQHGTISQ